MAQRCGSLDIGVIRESRFERSTESLTSDQLMANEQEALVARRQRFIGPVLDSTEKQALQEWGVL